MKHSEMTALASLFFLAQIVPKWVSTILWLVLGGISNYLAYQDYLKFPGN